MSGWSDICAAVTTPGTPPGRVTWTLPVASSTRFTVADSTTVPGSGAPTSPFSPGVPSRSLPLATAPPGARESLIFCSPLSERITVALTTWPTAKASCGV